MDRWGPGVNLKAPPLKHLYGLIIISGHGRIGKNYEKLTVSLLFKGSMDLSAEDNDLIFKQVLISCTYNKTL